MGVVRNVLLLAALVSLVALLLIESDFRAAQSFLAETLGSADNPTRKMVEGIGTALVQSYGIALGLALAASYVPAAVHLYPDYNAEKGGSGAFLSSETLGMILRFLAIIAPPVLGAILPMVTSGS
jgi:hypothetical protein